MKRYQKAEEEIRETFKMNGGFSYTLHARKRMIERKITMLDVEEAYLNGSLRQVEYEDDLELKAIWEGQDCDGEIIRLVMVCLKKTKTIIITVIGDIYEN